MALDTDGTLKLSPPYISFATFKTFISDLQEQGVPQRIDKHVWRHRFSGGVGPYLVAALRFFKLVTDADESTAELKAVAKAYGTNAWTKHLQDMIKTGYAPVMALDLNTIAAGHLADFFGQQYGLESNTLRKAVTFFVHAAKEAGIPLSQRIVKTTRTVGPRKKANGAGKGKKDTPDPTVKKSPPIDPVVTTKDNTWRTLLLEKFPQFDPAWAPEVQAKWFDAFEKLMAPPVKN